MNILTVFTGGTIGSKVYDNVVDVSKNSEFTVLKLFLEKYSSYKNINFTCKEPLELLSENLNYSQWNIIIKFLNSVDFSKYDGVIITHGSDTLSFTSAFLGLMYSYINKPVVIVAANYPPNLKESNGITNLKNAVDFINNCKNRGVYVSYSNDNNAIYLSTRLKESDPYLDEFTSFSSSAFGTIQNCEFKINKQIDNPSIKEVENNANFKLNNEFSLENKVMMIKQYPNLDYDNYNLNDISAVLLCLYHSGTACTDTIGSKSVLKFLDRCKNQNIPVYGTSFKKSDIKYSTTYKLFENYLIPLYNISLESAYAKLCIAYNQKDIEPIEYINKNIFFEHI